ncbi:hypothetical protein RFI_12739 [Reticulomyxa filosa]|uniref:Exportin-1/Importin-beta-like domain-containing protein n=1 Tax=Reticulomyxa filosa TaxID=46433 RepID=X6NDN8_RETFI|nr:hypothetical protein RFI_12739 [Reticulomyxa filosa]|eukprot:ETO24420.1 hypothetical protein RFI_12739 [Reticulomyxa filosa]
MDNIQSANNKCVEVLCSQTLDAISKMYAITTSHEQREQMDHFLTQVCNNKIQNKNKSKNKNKNNDQKFPNDKDSWTVLSMFLKQPKLAKEAHFFAANMLRKKVLSFAKRNKCNKFAKLCKHLNQMSPNVHGKMTDFILTLLLQFKVNSVSFFFFFLSIQVGVKKKIRTQLEIGLAYIFIQRPDWHDVVPHLMRQLATPEKIVLLLEILTVFAEEIFHWKIPFPDKLKKAAIKNLEKHAKAVLVMLETLFQNTGERIDLQLAVFECFHAWLFVMDNASTQLLGTSRLSACLFQALQHEQLFPIAASSICRLLRLQSSHNESDDEEETSEGQDSNCWKKSFSFIVPKRGEKKKKELALKDDAIDTEKVEHFTKIYVDTAEVYLEWILEDTDIKSRQLVEAILEATRLKGEPCVSMYTMYFWEHFLEPFCTELQQMNASTDVEEDDTCSNGGRPCWNKGMKWLIENIIPPLTIAMISNCEWPEERTEPTLDTLETFYSYRWQCSDVLAKIGKILSAQCLLRQFCKMLDPLVHISNPSPKVHAQIEAILFSIRSNYKVYEKTKPGGTHPLIEVQKKKRGRHLFLYSYTSVFRIIPRLKDNHYRTRSTAIGLIAQHANILDVKEEDTFDKCMAYVCQGLSDTRVCSEAAHCIVRVCEEFCCEETFVNNNWPKLFQLYENSFHLPIHDACEITRGVVMVIYSLTDYNRARQQLKSILDTPVQYLDVMTKTNSNFVSIHNKRPVKLVDIVKRISVIWKYCVFSNPFPIISVHVNHAVPLLVAFFQKLWPYFKVILQTFQVCLFFNDDDLMEKTINVVKYTIRNEPEAFAKYAKHCFVEALDMTTQLYQQSPKSFVLLFFFRLFV